MDDFKRLLNYVRPFWATFAFAIIAMVLVAVFETATGALLVPIFNQFMPEAGQNSRTPFDLNNLIPKDDWFRAWLAISTLLITFTVLKGIMEFISSFLMAHIGQKAVLNLRKELYAHLLAQSTSFFERHRTNYLVSRLVVSCSAIENAVSINLRDLIRESFILIFFVGAAFYLNWKLMLGAIIIAPITAYLTSKFGSLLRRFATQAIEGNKLLTDVAQETLANQTIVKAYAAEEREMGRFEHIAGLIARANMRIGRILSISPPVLEFVGYVAAVVFFYFGLREINSNSIDPAEFFTFLFFLFRCYDPIRKISRQHNEISKSFAAAKDVWNILDEHDELPEAPDAQEIRLLQNEIRFQNVSFKYGRGEQKILKSIDLTVPKGSMLALVGESGGGKSSLIKLVQRLYDPEEGAIFWDGVDLREIKIASLRRQISLVTQETVLFNDTISYNISYGDPDATSQAIRNAAKIALADGFIDELPDKYETIVGERGTFLSGGQRQRIAIARAVLKNSPVLILDEATSALDTESESLVQKALVNLMENRTSIVIAHRLSTIRRADKIVVMEKGEIVEAGRHEELLKRGGRYKRLYELQFAEVNEETG